MRNISIKGEKMFLKDRKGIMLITCYLVIVVLTILGSAFLVRSVSEKRIAERERDLIRAFNIAEAGLERALYDLKRDSKYSPGLPSWRDDNIYTSATEYIDISQGVAGAIPQNYPTFYLLPYGTVYDYSLPPVSTSLDGGSFTVELANVAGKDDEIWVKSTGTFNSLSRIIQARIRIENSWLSKIPAAIYSNGAVKVKFKKRDDAYIDGDEVAGIYASGDVKVKKDGEGRIDGNPPIQEEAPTPEALEDGIWDAFDINALRDIAIEEGTYFSGDEYNKKGKYILPVEEGETAGVFFFDTRDGVVLDDDAIDEANEAKVELRGTCGNQISGIIVVVGDLTIKDTKDCDFLFDGVILVLDDLKMHDNRHGRRDGSNDSDIFIRGALLSDNIIQKGKKRKKKPAADIKNATIEYDKNAITNASSYGSSQWRIILESWQEI